MHVLTVGHGIRPLEELIDTPHLLGPGRREGHKLYDGAEIRTGKLFLCGALVA